METNNSWNISNNRWSCLVCSKSGFDSTMEAFQHVRKHDPKDVQAAIRRWEQR